MKRSAFIFILLILITTFRYPSVASLAQGTIPTAAIYLPLVANVIPTATPIPTVTPTPVATDTPQPNGSNVVIAAIFYDGKKPIVESDEYAVISNNSNEPVSMTGWRLNAGNSGQNFIFPSFTIAPNQSIRVYTNEVHPETGGFSFGVNHAIWNNKSDCGYLYDGNGVQVSTYCY